MLVANPANAGQFARRYQLSRLNFITLVAVVLPRMPAPDGGVMIDLSDPVVATYFSATPDGKWQCKQTGNILQFGMLNFFQISGQNAYCGLTYVGLPRSNEIPIAEHPGVVKQEFERGWLVYDPGHVVDHPPAAGEVYLMQLPK